MSARDRAWGRALRLGAGGQEGFTMAEVLVAMVLSVVIIGALTELFVTGGNSALSAQRQTQLIAVADQQIEKIRQQVKTNSNGFAALAMSAAPAAGATTTLVSSPHAPLDPNYFYSSISGCGPSSAGYKIETNWDNTTEGTLASVPTFSLCGSGVEPLVIKTGVAATYGAPVTGFVSPLPATVPVGSSTAKVYTYVTATSLGCSTAGGADYASGTAGACYADARRVIVAVLLASTNGRVDIGPATPVYVSTVISNPVPSNQSNSSTGITLGLNIG